jgi:hypothetical protein
VEEFPVVSRQTAHSPTSATQYMDLAWFQDKILTVEKHQVGEQWSKIDDSKVFRI